MVRRSFEKILTLLACMHSLAAAPLSQTRLYPIPDFGAVGDAKTLNTRAIQKAIDTASSNGGGSVVVPGGTFITGAIYLKPGVGLLIEKDGVLKGSTDIADFPITKTRIEGHFQQWASAMINADGIDHLRISGAGTLDGSGAPFYAAFYTRRDRDRSTTNLDVPRPRMLYLSRCTDARVEGLHFLNSAFWNLHLYHCSDVLVDSIDIDCPAKSPSTDGIDIDSSRNITVHNCQIANNDDEIALKGSKGPDAMNDRDSPPVEHIHIYDCTFDRGRSMLTCGSEATIVRDVEVDHCKAIGRGPQSMLCIKLRTDTQQLFENIRFHDINLTGKGEMLDIASWKQYANLEGHAPPTHVVRTISIKNISGTFGSLGAVKPTAGDQIEKLTLQNVDLKLVGSKTDSNIFSHLVLQNVMLNGKESSTRP